VENTGSPNDIFPKGTVRPTCLRVVGSSNASAVADGLPPFTATTAGTGEGFAFGLAAPEAAPTKASAIKGTM
jgi:hypothetical protein